MAVSNPSLVATHTNLVSGRKSQEGSRFLHMGVCRENPKSAGCLNKNQVPPDEPTEEGATISSSLEGAHISAAGPAAPPKRRKPS